MPHHHDDMRSACDHVCRSDPTLAKAYEIIGLPSWRAQPASYASLARTIVYQQISTKAGDSIWARVSAWAENNLTPERIVTTKETELQDCGLSRPKIRHMTTIAEAVLNGALPLDRLHRFSDIEARKCLIAVKGIGPWTAELFMMCSLRRMDAFPEGDVGMMEALRLLREDDERLSPKAFLALAETWRPYRAAAAHLLWGYINHIRGDIR